MRNQRLLWYTSDGAEILAIGTHVAAGGNKQELFRTYPIIEAGLFTLSNGNRTP